ncbi:MAG: DUF5336 domain-containing protein [Mycobacteriaceae bacterium]
MTNMRSGQPDTAASDSPLGRILGLVAAALGVLTLLLGFAPLASRGSPSGSSASFYEVGGLPAYMLVLLLVGGLLAGLGNVPKVRSYNQVAAVLTVSGFLALLVSVISLAGQSSVDVGFGAYIALLFALLAAVATVGALLIEVGIISPQQRRTEQVGYAQAGTAGPYGQYSQPTGPSYGAAAGQGQYGGPPQGGYGQNAGQAQGSGQQYAGSYGAPTPQQFGQQQAPYQQQQQQQQQQYTSAPPQQQSQRPAEPAWQQGDTDADDQTRAYTPQTQSFGTHPTEAERPRENPYGTPPQQ